MKIDVTKNKILFYDGDCGFCNSSVQFVLKNRKHNHIYFATLQSELAKTTLGKKGITIELDTLYYLKNNIVYNKSSAGLQISKELKLPYSIISILYFVPKFIRDFFYIQIAKRRHKIGSNFCVLPNEAEKSLFI